MPNTHLPYACVSTSQTSCMGGETSITHPHKQTDATCTDIIHYEEQKLVPYVGNLSAFVAKRPDAKHYYELGTDTLQYVCMIYTYLYTYRE